MSNTDKLPSTPRQKNNNTIYIGNMDKRMREIHILKLFQPFGKVKNFQFLFTKEGEPRGYMFLTYEESEDAERAVQNMNGKTAMDRVLKVKIAVPTTQKKVVAPEKPAVVTKEDKIETIQRKLKQLQEPIPARRDANTPPERSQASKNLKQRHKPY